MTRTLCLGKTLPEPPPCVGHLGLTRLQQPDSYTGAVIPPAVPKLP